MFSRMSRYHRLPDIVTTNRLGQASLSKALRPAPEAPGTFRHIVEDGDRLDHLAYRYYRQPHKWWRISDGNPEVPSPLALVGKEPVITDRFAVTFQGAQPPWPAVMRNLTQHIGVEEVKIVETAHLTPAARTLGGRRVILHTEEFERALVVTYNELTTNAGDVARIIAACGFVAGPPERLGRIGKEIIIPRDVTG